MFRLDFPCHAEGLAHRRGSGTAVTNVNHFFPICGLCLSVFTESDLGLPASVQAGFMGLLQITEHKAHRGSSAAGASWREGRAGMGAAGRPGLLRTNMSPPLRIPPHVLCCFPAPRSLRPRGLLLAACSVPLSTCSPLPLVGPEFALPDWLASHPQSWDMLLLGAALGQAASGATLGAEPGSTELCAGGEGLSARGILPHPGTSSAGTLRGLSGISRVSSLPSLPDETRPSGGPLSQ